MVVGAGRSTLTWLAIVSIVGGCSTASEETGPASLDDVPRVALVEELRIGSVNDPDLGFTRMGDRVEVVAGDTIYVAEESAPEIRVYSPEGRLVRRIGRRGEGPGELGYIGGWGIQGDTVWVLELSRVSLFRRDGSLILANRFATHSVEAGPYRITLGPAFMTPEGRLISELKAYTAPDPDMPTLEARIPTLLLALDGEVIDTIGFGSMTMGAGDRSFRRLASYPFPIYQSDFPRAYPLQDVEGSDTLRIERPPAESAGWGALTVTRVSSRDTIVHRQLRYSPVPVPDTYRDSVIDAQVESMASRYGNASGVRAAMEEMYRFAAFYPPVSELRVTDDGSMWLLRQRGEDDGSHWILLDAEGLPRHEVVLPSETEILWSDGDVLYVSEPDELEIPWLVRYRMASPD